jgi:hypothetical protein
MIVEDTDIIAAAMGLHVVSDAGKLKSCVQTYGVIEMPNGSPTPIASATAMTLYANAHVILVFI